MDPGRLPEAAPGERSALVVGLLISAWDPGEAWLDSLIQRLAAQGLAVGVLHWDAGDTLADDRKDTGRFRQAGAVAAALAAPGFLQITVAVGPALSIEEAVGHLGRDLDLVLVGGTQPFPFPYILVGEPGQAASSGDDPQLLAVVSDADQTGPAPAFHPAEMERLANLLRSWLSQQLTRDP